jgi:tripartite-type tricarboxylate transporter receptor subunit TctC
MAEAGVPGFEWFTWASLVVPVGTPQPIVDRLVAETRKAVNAPDVREKLVAQGLEPIGSPPEQVTASTKAGLARMREVVNRAGIKGD